MFDELACLNLKGHGCQMDVKKTLFKLTGASISASKVGFPVTPRCMLRNDVNAVSVRLFLSVL